MAHLQSRGTRDTTSATSTGLAYSSNLTSGSTLICWVQADNATTGTFSVSDSANGSWTAIGSPQTGGTGLTSYRGQAFFKTGNASTGTPTVTVTTSSTTTSRTITIAEYSSAAGGVRSSAYGTANSGSGATVSCPSVTPTVGTDQVVAFCGGQVTTTAATAPFTLRQGQQLGSLADNTSPTGGTAYAAQFTFGSTGWGAITGSIVLMAAGGGSAPVNTAVPTVSMSPSFDFGNTASSTTGTWNNSPTSYAYQWQNATTLGGTYSNIGGATSSSYVVPRAQIGKFLRCAVTATNATGSATANSVGFGPITAFSRVVYNQVFSADQEVYATAAADNTFDLFVRYDTATDTGYMLEAESDTRNVHIYRVTGIGGFVNLGSAASGLGSFTSHQFGLRVVGTTLTVYIDGASTLSLTDSLYNRTGEIGFGIGTGMLLDNFGGGDSSSSVVVDPGTTGETATLQVQFAFDVDPSDNTTTPTWVDFTDRVAQVTIKRGRQRELDRIEAGTCQIILDNSDRVLDPTNAASPYYPHVLPLRRVRVQALSNDNLFTLFTGYVERWPQEWQTDVTSMSVMAVDGFEVLSHAALSSTITSAASGAQVSAALDQAGWGTGSTARLIDTGQSTLVATTPATDGSTTALSYIQEAVDSELGLFFIDGSGRAVFQDRLKRQSAPYTVSQAMFSDQYPELEYADLRSSYDRDFIVNDWRVTASGGTPQQATDSTSMTHYFRRTNQRTTLLSTNVDALAQAQELVLRMKDPQFRFDQLAVEPLADANLWQQAFTREISDRITVVRNPHGGGASISQDCHIEAIQWDISPTTPWRMTWQLSPASTRNVFTLDDATLGLLDTTNVLTY